MSESPPSISVITEIELLCWKTPSAKDTELLNDFIHDALVIELEDRVKLKTAAIRKNYKIKLPDAIIAATAITYNYALLTRNVSDFNHIEGLEILNPWHSN